MKKVKVDTQDLFKSLPYLILVMVLLIFYIHNVYRVEKKVRQINEMQSEIESLKREYFLIKQRSWYDGTLNQVTKKIDGVKVPNDVKLPKKITRVDA